MNSITDSYDKINNISPEMREALKRADAIRKSEGKKPYYDRYNSVSKPVGTGETEPRPPAPTPRPPAPTPRPPAPTPRPPAPTPRPPAPTELKHPEKPIFGGSRLAPTYINANVETIADSKIMEIWNPLRLWYILRSDIVDYKNSGRITRQELRDTLCDKLSQFYFCNWRNLRKIIKAGEFIFWKYDKEDHILWMNGKLKVCQRMDVDYISRTFHIDSRKMLNVLDSHLEFSKAMHTGKERPISRKAIENKTNIPIRTQSNYDLINEVKKTKNYAILCTLDDKDKVEHFASLYGNSCFEFFDHQKVITNKKRGWLVRQLPNTYHTNISYGFCGHNQKINRILSPAFYTTHGKHLNKVYFESEKQAKRYFGKLDFTTGKAERPQNFFTLNQYVTGKARATMKFWSINR